MKRLGRWLKRLALWVGLGWLSFAMSWSTLSAGLLDMAKFTAPRASTTIVDRDGAPLRFHRVDGKHRRWISIDGLPAHVLDAFLAAEDRRFYEHDGVDRVATVRAVAFTLTENSPPSGASTITQQVIKLVYGRPHGRWSKPLEILRAWALEERRSKRFILEQYVNRVPYANEVEGLEAASESYFGKTASELTLAEAALLAGLPQAPSRLDPRRDLEAATARRNTVLDRMARMGRLDASRLVDALASPILVRDTARPWRAARFVDHELDAFRAGRRTADHGVIHTTLDAQLQSHTEAVLGRAIEVFEDRGVHNAAAIVLGPEGEVRAYVAAARSGSDAPGGQLDLLRARRQPGSTLKPFVYQLLFESGEGPATVLDDVRLPMTSMGGALFEAENFDGVERGPVRAREALASSLNLAALDAARRVGVSSILARLTDLGLRGVRDAETHGAAVVLGGIDVTAVELAHAYRSLALRANGEATDGVDGNRDANRGNASTRDTAATLTAHVLRDGDTRRAAFGDDLEAQAGGAFGLKTGTSSGFRDAWAATFADGHTVVVWFGDPEGRPMAGVSGFEIAAPAAARILATARRPADVPLPSDVGRSPAPQDGVALTRAAVCPLSGLAPGPSCPQSTLELFAPGHEPDHVCAWHTPAGVVLPPRYARWSQAMGRAQELAANHTTEVEGRASLRIVQPRNGDRLLTDPSRATRIELLATFGGAFADGLEWWVDGERVGEDWFPTEGRHRVVVRRGGAQAEAEVEVETLQGG